MPAVSRLFVGIVVATSVVAIAFALLFALTTGSAAFATLPALVIFIFWALALVFAPAIYAFGFAGWKGWTAALVAGALAGLALVTVGNWLFEGHIALPATPSEIAVSTGFAVATAIAGLIAWRISVRTRSQGDRA